MNNLMAGDAELTGYQFLQDTLFDWGITLYAGVTGGGVIHFLKYLPPLTQFIA